MDGLSSGTAKQQALGTATFTVLAESKFPGSQRADWDLGEMEKLYNIIALIKVLGATKALAANKARGPMVPWDLTDKAQAMQATKDLANGYFQAALETLHDTSLLELKSIYTDKYSKETDQFSFHADHLSTIFKDFDIRKEELANLETTLQNFLKSIATLDALSDGTQTEAENFNHVLLIPRLILQKTEGDTEEFMPALKLIYVQMDRHNYQHHVKDKHHDHEESSFQVRSL